MKRSPSAQRKAAIDELLAQALDALAGPTIVTDADLAVVAMTPDARARVGKPKGGVETLTLDDSTPAARRAIDRALVSGHDARIEVLVGSAGDRRRLRATVAPIASRRGSRYLAFALGAEESAAGDTELFGLWTRDPKMRDVIRIVKRAARADATVLVRGETGVGKELVAHAIHACSARSEGPFRALNCAAVPSNLLESELFGHARGAFTGAVRDVPGHFELAHTGTLLLDEIGDLPLELQAKLLRVLETRTIVRVGSRRSVPVDVRIVAATNRALRREVERGRFRADLMYRLRVIPIFIPPLRARPRDIELLASRFVDELNEKKGRRIDRISDEAWARLHGYGWPGNVRELRSAIEYAFVMGEGRVLGAEDLPRELVDPDWSFDELPARDRSEAGSTSSRLVDAADERGVILRALDEAGGRREVAAEALGISRATLWRKMKALGLSGAGAKRTRSRGR